MNKGGFRYAPIIKNPIPSMNYIEKAVSWLRKRFDKITSRGK